MENVYWAIAYKNSKTGAVAYPWIGWQLQVFQNRKYAKKTFDKLYKDISKHLKIIKVRLVNVNQ